MKVRAADPRDARALLALRCALWPEREVRHLEQELRQRAESRARHETLLVEDEMGAVCGFAELTRNPGEPGQPHTVMLQAVFVAPPARRRGAAARLMMAAERWAHSRGASMLVCEVDADSIHRHDTLGWLGFADPQRRLRLQRPVSPPMDIARETPASGAALGDEQPPLVVERARSPWFAVLNVVLLGAAVVSFMFTDIYSRDALRGVVLPLLDAAFVVYFIFLVLMLRYRKRVDSSARADRLFRNDR